MTTDRSTEQEARRRAAQAQVLPEASGPLQQQWPALGKADEPEDADEDDEIEDLDAEDGEAQDGESKLSPSGTRRRRRRRHRRSSVPLQAAASADFIQPSAPEWLAADASEDEAGRPRNVVTWNDLLGSDHDLKPESPSGGFQCAKAACWDRLAQEQIPQQQLYQEKLQQPLRQHQDYQQLGQNCIDMQHWVVTESPPDWSPAHSAHLQDWLYSNMMQGSVPQLSELDVVLQSLSSEVYED